MLHTSINTRIFFANFKLILLFDILLYNLRITGASFFIYNINKLRIIFIMSKIIFAQITVRIKVRN